MTNLFKIAEGLTGLMIEAQSFPEDASVEEWDNWLADFAEAKETEKEKIEAIAIVATKHKRLQAEVKEEVARLKKLEAGFKRTEDKLKNYLDSYMGIINKKKYETGRFKIHYRKTPGRLVLDEQTEMDAEIEFGISKAKEELSIRKEDLSTWKEALLKEGKTGKELPEGMEVVIEDRLYIS